MRIFLKLQVFMGAQKFERSINFEIFGKYVLGKLLAVRCSYILFILLKILDHL